MSKRSTTLEKNEIEALAIGGFDGVHIAHRIIIEKTGEKGGALIIEKPGANLTPGKYRCLYIKKPCFFMKLSDIKGLSGEEFIEKIEKEFPSLKKIVIGYDFHFGKERAYKAYDLKKMFKKEVEIVKEIKAENISVHSRTIREFLKKGDMKTAKKLLGRDYRIFASVVKGLGIGKKELVATLNLDPDGFLLPKEGVYASFCKIENKLFPAATFIGKRETIDGSFSVETHIIGKEIETPEEKVELIFKEFVRENRKFPSLKELKKQILKDIEKINEILS